MLFQDFIVPPTRGQLTEIKPFLVFVGIPMIIVDIPPFLRRVTVLLTPENTPGLGIIGVSFGVSFGILATEVRSKNGTRVRDAELPSYERESD